MSVTLSQNRELVQQLLSACEEWRFA